MSISTRYIVACPAATAVAIVIVIVIVIRREVLIYSKAKDEIRSIDGSCNVI